MPQLEAFQQLTSYSYGIPYLIFLHHHYCSFAPASHHYEDGSSNSKVCPLHLHLANYEVSSTDASKTCLMLLAVGATILLQTAL